MVSLKGAKSLYCPTPIQLVQKHNSLPSILIKRLSVPWGQFR